MTQIELLQFLIDLNGLQGRVTPQLGWNSEIVFEEMNYGIIENYRKISDRIYREGYQLWFSGNVQNCFSNRKVYPRYLFYRGQIKAAMKQKIYVVNICMNTSFSTSIKWKTCGCPAGVNGECKHVVAVLLYIHHHITIQEQNFPESIPPTEKQQVWHIKKPVSDGEILVMDMPMSRNSQNCKSESASEYAASVDVTKCVTKATLMQLCQDLPVGFPIVDTIRNSQFEPIICKSKLNEIIGVDLFVSTWFLSKISFI